MNGFDQEWLTQHTRRTGARATVQAGAGVLVGSTGRPEYKEAQRVLNAELTEVVERLGTGMHGIDKAAPDDPFAPIDTSTGITLVLPYPVSGNHYKGERIIPATKTRPAFSMKFLTEEAKVFKAEVQRRALLAGLKRPFPWRVIVHGQLYPARPQDWEKRARKDPQGWDDDVRCIDVADNCPKVTLDALQGIVYANDKMIWDSRFQRMEPDAHGARVVVTVRPIVRVVVQEGLL